MTETFNATLVSFSLPVQAYRLTNVNGLQSVTVPFSFKLNLNGANPPYSALVVARDKSTGKVISTFAARVSESDDAINTATSYSGSFQYFNNAGDWEIQAIGLSDSSNQTSQLLSVNTLPDIARTFVVTSDDTTPPQLDLRSFSGIGTLSNPILIDSTEGVVFNAPTFAFDSNLSSASIGFSNNFTGGYGFNVDLIAGSGPLHNISQTTQSGKYSANYAYALDYFRNRTQINGKNLLSDFSDGVYIINPDKPGIIDSGFSDGKFWIRFSERVNLSSGQFSLSLESSIGGLGAGGITATDSGKITWNAAHDTAYLDLSDYTSRNGIYTLSAYALNMQDLQGNQETTSYYQIKEHDFRGPDQSFAELQINALTPQDQNLNSMLALTDGKILVSYGNFTDTGSSNGSASFAVLQKNSAEILNRVTEFSLDLNPTLLSSVALPDGGFAILGIASDFSSRPTIYFFNANGTPKDQSQLVIPGHGLDGVSGAMGSAPWNYSVGWADQFTITRVGNTLNVVFTETRTVYRENGNFGDQKYLVAYRLSEGSGQYQLSNALPETISDSYTGSVYKKLTALPDGGFLAIDYATYAPPVEIRVQRYNADLAPIGDPLQFTMTDYGADFYVLDNGQLAVIYRANSNPGAWGTGTSGEIRGKIFSMTDIGFELVAPPGGNDNGFLIETWTTYPPTRLPKLSPDGKFLIYDDVPGLEERSVRIKQFDMNTQQVGENFYDLGDYRWGEQFNGQLVTLADGSVFGAWTSYLQDGSGTGVFGRMINEDFFNPADPPPPDPVDANRGTPSNDVLNGTGAADVMFGYGGDDRIFGFGGDDIFNGGEGDDFLDGGNGIDTADFSEKTQSVHATLNGNFLSEVRINGRIEDKLSNIENIIAGSADDILKGDAQNNWLVGNSGNDELYGGAGVNTLAGGFGNDRYFVDSAEDIIVELISDNTPSQQIFSIGNYNDVVVASVSYTLSAGAAIEDMIAAGSITRSRTNSNINLTGNELAQGLMGNEGRNILNGKMGDDILIGMGGNDHLLGEEGNDAFFSGTGNDLMSGGQGDDAFFFNINTGQGSGFFYEPFRPVLTGGNDQADGGIGNDTLFIDSRNFDKIKIVRSTNSAYEFTVTASNRDSIQIKNIEKIIFGKIESENLSAEKSYALIDGYTGTSNDDWIIGTTGNDEILGHNGADILDGSRGNDRLKGGLGNDVLTGGSGRDYFEFNSMLSSSTNLDKITDFARGHDKLVLDSDIFMQIERVSSKNLIIGTTSQLANRSYDGDDFLIFNRQTKILSYDATGFGGNDAIAFVELSGINVLSFSDFLVV
jgi:Ca2+-binding RTX toxin-like protein